MRVAGPFNRGRRHVVRPRERGEHAMLRQRPNGGQGADPVSGCGWLRSLFACPYKHLSKYLSQPTTRRCRSSSSAAAAAAAARLRVCTVANSTARRCHCLNAASAIPELLSDTSGDTRGDTAVPGRRYATIDSCSASRSLPLGQQASGRPVLAACRAVPRQHANGSRCCVFCPHTDGSVFEPGAATEWPRQLSRHAVSVASQRADP